jgi:hypothetical protein
VSESTDNGVKYFSGTATYRKTFDVSSAMVAKTACDARLAMWKSWRSDAQRTGVRDALEKNRMSWTDRRGQSRRQYVGGEGGQPLATV